MYLLMVEAVKPQDEFMESRESLEGVLSQVFQTNEEPS